MSEKNYDGLPATREERRIDFLPGYDHRDEPNDQRGAHSMEIRFALIGDGVAMSWTVNTGWMARPLTGAFIRGRRQDRRDKPGIDARLWDYSPSAGPVHLHSSVQAQGWWMGPQPCDLIGGECYGDSGYLIGDRVLDALIARGNDGVWSELATIRDEWLAYEPAAPVSLEGDK